MKINSFKPGGTSLCLLLAAALLVPAVPAAETDGEPVGFSREDVASNLVIIACRAGKESFSSRGVIVKMDESPYLLTSLSSILGAEEISFMTETGDKVLPRRVELSGRRDLVRLALAEEWTGLPLSDRAGMNTPVTLFKGGGGEPPAVEQGKIIGVGGDRIEISAAIDPSCSGAPALNAEREVVGIAAYSREFSSHAMKTGTRFDRDARHFCYRVGRNDWKPVNWRAFNGKYGSRIRRHDGFCNDILAALKQGEEFDATAAQAREMAAGCRTHAREIRLLIKQQHDLTDYLLNDLEEKAEMLEYLGGLFQDYAGRRD
jgi:hypothetical protein